MADAKEIQKIIERAAEALAGMRDDVARKVAAKVASEIASPPGGAPTDRLFASVASIQDATGQADILNALLDGCAGFCGRVALFVVRGGALSGWQARGFADNDAVKKMSLDGGAGLPARALQDRTPVAAAAVEFDSNLIATQGNPAEGNALVMPLVVRDKVPAILYADSGPDGTMDSSALQVLLRAASVWLEVLSYRKAGAPAAAPERPGAEPMIVPPERVQESVAALTATPPPAAVPAPAPAPAPVAETIPGATPEEQEVHKKARRFAKLLVDEIKLYNPQKVNEGRQQRDLYNRLKEDIEKSRATYEKRYGQTVAGSANYFMQEVVRVLAENDVTVMGSNFPHY